jgi:SAM-dependent methyltransferase
MTDRTLRSFYEKPEVPASSGQDRARRQARMLREVLRDVAPPAAIVDIGCGDGAATSLAAQVNPGHRIVGLDWSADALRQARSRGLTLLRAEVESTSLPIASGRADVVIMSELIEHLVDPDSALEEARRVLKPGGTLLLSTPNLAAWYNRGLLALGVQPLFTEVSLRGVFGRPGARWPATCACSPGGRSSGCWPRAASGPSGFLARPIMTCRGRYGQLTWPSARGLPRRRFYWRGHARHSRRHRRARPGVSGRAGTPRGTSAARPATAAAPGLVAGPDGAPARPAGHRPGACPRVRAQLRHGVRAGAAVFLGLARAGRRPRPAGAK